MAEQRPSQSGGSSSSEERRPQGPAQERNTQLTETARQVGETAAHAYAEGREQLGAMEEYLEDSIRKKPLQSLMIAAGVGLLIGLLWKK
jgi:ElaB/YqjD/DUF883 family membrane-anchored ribosome-binding protein